jgi:hypothetical protein
MRFDKRLFMSKLPSSGINWQGGKGKLISTSSPFKSVVPQSEFFFVFQIRDFSKCELRREFTHKKWKGKEGYLVMNGEGGGQGRGKRWRPTWDTWSSNKFSPSKPTIWFIMNPTLLRLFTFSKLKIEIQLFEYAQKEFYSA